MDLNTYQREAMKTALPTAQNPEYMILNLAAEAGEVAGKLAKCRRDNWTYQRLIEEITPELGDVLWQIAGACDALGLSLDGVAQANLAKLADRQQRGKIGGSGDAR